MAPRGFVSASITFSLPPCSWRDITHAAEDVAGAVGEFAHLMLGGHAAEDQHGINAAFHARDDIGIHAVADDGAFLRRHAQQAQAMAHHQRIGLAQIIGLASRGQFDGAHQRLAGRNDAALHRAGQVRVGADELGAGAHQLHGPLDFFKAVGVRFTHHDIVGIDLVHGKARLVQGAHQAGFADDVGASSGTLLLEECRRAQRAGIEVLLVHLQPQPLQLLLQFLGRTLAGIGQKQELLVLPLQKINKLPHAGQKQVAVIDHAVHIADEALLFAKRLQCIGMLLQVGNSHGHSPHFLVHWGNAPRI